MMGSSAGSSVESRDAVGLGTAEVAGPGPRGCAQAERVRVDEHRAAGPVPPRLRRYHSSIALFSLPVRAMAIVAASARSMSQGREGGVLGADLDQELAISPRSLGERRDLDRGARGGGGEHDRHHGEQAALRGRLAAAHLLLERQQPPERLRRSEARRPAGWRPPGTRARGAAPDRGPPAVSSAPRRRRSPPAAPRPGNAPWKGLAPHSRARSDCSTGVRQLHATGRLGQRACARGRLRRAEVEQDRPPQRVGASSSSARRRNRTAWSAEPRLVTCSAEVVSASSAHCSPTGRRGALGQQVGGHALVASRMSREGSRAAVRCSCARSAGGIESCSACWTIGWTNLGGRPG